MEGGETGVDDDHALTWTTNIGATIMGRNMFGPVRGPWGDEAWTGWWGDDPPFHTPVFVLTHHPREPFEMRGGTSFHFVTGGIEAVLARATAGPAGRTSPSAAAPTRPSSTCAQG
jgi:dihydrofolate reductase